MKLDLNAVRDELIRHLQEVIESIQKTELPAIENRLLVTTTQINDKDYVEEIANTLPKEGNHIYWFEINGPERLLGQFNNRDLTKGYKLARDNKGTDSKYVYVGSCTQTKLSSRFKQHCGYGHDQTYSLQLSKWVTEPDLTFTFSYVKINDKVVIAYLEDQLHRQLKPLFGKPGANNKITKN